MKLIRIADVVLNLTEVASLYYSEESKTLTIKLRSHKTPNEYFAITSVSREMFEEICDKLMQVSAI